ncbi:hypothetical protein ACTS94_05065 [Empedobacter falsenii]
MSSNLIKIQKENLPCLAVNQIGFFEKYNLDQQSKAIIEIERNIDLDHTLNLPVIQRLGKESKKDVLLMIERALRMTTSMFKYAEKMEDYQISMMASDLYDKFSYNTVEDIILMLRYARQGKLGGSKSVFDNDTLFNIYVPKYLDMKAEKWEKENEFIVDDVDDVPLTKEEKEKQQKWLDELHKSWKADRKPKKRDFFEPIDHHSIFIENLKKDVGEMTKESIQNEMIRAKNHKMMDAYEIYETELKKRK